MKNLIIKYCCLLFLLFHTNIIFGGVEPAISAPLDGKYFIAFQGNPNYMAVPIFKNELNNYTTSPPYSFPAGQTIRKIDNLIQLYLETETTTTLDSPFSLEVEVGIVKHEYGANTFTTDKAKLTIKYDPKERTKWTEKATFHFTNCGRAEYKVLNVTLNSSTTLTDGQKAAIANVVGLRSDIIIERYFDFDVNARLFATQIKSKHNTSNNEVEINWPVIPGAEYYDLEWAYVDDYDGVGGKKLANTLKLNTHYNLNRNSTRVRIAQNNYSFPLIYEGGYLLFRVRGIGMEYDPNTDLVYTMPGKWSNPENTLPNGPDQAINADKWKDKFTIPGPYENDQFNWQIISSYAEEGKHKDIIGFRDGSQRNRQTVTGLSTDNLAMVAENIYDHQGRAAIQVLPVPANDPTLKFYKHFNKNTSGNPYTRADFDLTPNCNLSAVPMGISSGASQYYSPTNPVKTNENAYIPDAEGFPFIQTEFTPDNTGRIRRQSGVGIHHKLGSGHESNYFYGTPVQEELSMLFGVEVGDADHYKKNVVQDPNGQLSVSYLDLKGKVIATALAGNPPKNLDKLISYDSIKMDVDLMVFNRKDSLANELVASRSFTVTTDSDYNFSYTVSNAAFEAALCDGIKLCYDCVYDLEVTVIDNYSCNVKKYQEITQINPLAKLKVDGSLVVNDKCPKNATDYKLDEFSSNAFKIWLTVGSYTVTKKLKVNQAATDLYVKDYLDRFDKECKSVYDSILQSYLAQVDSLACELEDDEKTLNRCEIAREGMLSDLNPGGQYGLIDWATYSANDPVSVFNTGNRLPQTGANWRNPASPYLNEDKSAAVLINTLGNPVAPNDPSISLQEFLDAWEPSWAEALLPYHPEYCYLSWCEDDNKSFDFDVELAETNTYQDAVKKKFLSLSSPESIVTIDPYFKPGGGGTTSTNSPTPENSMKAAFAQYYPKNPATTNQKYSMIQVAVMAALGSASKPSTIADAQNWISSHAPDPITEDKVWEQFRALYLSKKEEFQYFDRTDFAMNFCSNKGGYNECIDADPFYWQKNGFANGGLFTSPFFSGGQSCSWTTFHLYKDKAIRFPSVYNIPVNFDPYGDPDEVIQDFAGWAGAMTSTNCDSCYCSEQSINQFINWVIPQSKNLAPGNIYSLSGYTIDPVLQQNFYSCFNISAPLIQVLKAGDLKRLSIYLKDNGGIILDSIVLLSGTINAFELADSISCIRYLGSDSTGNIIADATLYSSFIPKGTVSITIAPACPSWQDWKSCTKKSEIKSCPPTENARHLSQLLNTLISKNLLTTNFIINPNVNSSFLKYFNLPSIPNSNVTWNGKLTGNTINATVTGNQAVCRFTLDLPTNVQLNTLGQVLSFTPDYAQIDAVTGYTYHALMKVALLNGGTPVLIKIKSSCFPMSYCLKCPPGESISPGTRIGNDPVPDKNAQKNKQRTPDPTLSQNPIGDVQDNIIAIHDPNKPCNGCDTLGYILDYDSLTIDPLGNESSIMIHTKPPTDLCDPCKWTIDTLPTIPIPNPCLEEQIIAAYGNASNAYQHYIDSLTKAIRNGYIRHCLNATETFSKKYTDALHHFTLYYYDQANNLLKTIPPDGVVMLTTTETKKAIDYMRDRNNPALTPVTPNHTVPSDYTYNSLNQLRKQSIPDHDGQSVFYYDYLSRIVVSQNPKQQKLLGSPSSYSYSLYDKLNRPYETGELINVITQMTDAIAKDENQLLNWINNTKNNQQKREITRTQYDNPLPGIANQFFNGDDSNYRSRVASVNYQERDGSLIEHSTFYKYDIHGNVKQLVQDVYQLGPKSIAYDYDLISGNVKKVYYQKDVLDQFLHWYEYDADNRITTVRTSFDGFVWDTDAEYNYYRHGPLARAELGDHKVQSLDFAYTIQGWIKGVNSGTLDANVDVGQDGVAGHSHHFFGRDAFGYLLRYHTDDYKMIGTAAAGKGWEPAYQGTGFHRSNRDLYNGNIQSMITAIGEPIESNMGIKPLGYAYTYDQLNRITGMKAYNGLNQILNNWNAANAMSDYETTYSYDGNGNLDSLIRKGTTSGGASLDMDEFKYHYTPGRNQLEYVSDKIPAANYPEDIDDQSPGNYQYDAIGKLISDQSEKINIKWNVSGKVKSIEKTATNEVIKLSYDPTGKRVIKSLFNTVTQTSKSTYYVLDATGNVMATYTNTETPPIKNKSIVWESAYLYGSSRLGEERIETSFAELKTLQNKQNNSWYSYRNRGAKFFELSNHLGNVLATVSDRKLPVFDGSNTVAGFYFGADIWTVSDYFPFGSTMPERSFSAGGYRYGFNGKENDDEVKGGGNYQDYGMRAYDMRLGRFFSVDPISSKYPMLTPYQFASNTPIKAIDLDGLEAANPYLFAEYNEINTAGDVAQNINAFLYNGVIAGPANLISTSAASLINSGSLISTSLIWSISSGFYFGATGDEIPSFVLGFDVNEGFLLVKEPESFESQKEYAKSTVSLIVSQATFIKAPENKFMETVVKEAEDQTVDAALDKLIPTTNEKTTRSTASTNSATTQPYNIYWYTESPKISTAGTEVTTYKKSKEVKEQLVKEGKIIAGEEYQK